MQGGFHFSRLGFYLSDSLVCNGHLIKNKTKLGAVSGRWKKMRFHVEEVCYPLIVRKILNKKDLGAAEPCLFKRGRIGLLFSRKAGQDSAREVCYYLKLLWGFFQGEKEVIYYL